ncbi:hypothetical protein, partial [Corynebacterium phoceense]|uniref:hypothetical protein n=1 Tax=Corynebacterium phoceense TaxID=1686286 RepID=UPI00211CF735
EQTNATPLRQTTNKAMTWHIQKLHKINNTDPHTRRGKRGASNHHKQMRQPFKYAPINKLKSLQ